MGTDIHVMHEVRSFPGGNRTKPGVWVNRDTWSANLDFALYPEDYENDDSSTVAYHFQIDYNDRIYKGRNYGLFGILAGIRFDAPQQIAYSPGIPNNVSYHTLSYVLRERDIMHTPGSVTLRQLEAFDWHERFEETLPYRVSRIHQILREDSGSITLTPELKKQIKSAALDDYITVTRQVPYSEIVETFYTETIPRLRSYLDPQLGITEDDIRLVFYFDS